jgi:elongation factor 1 alpha-like protein
LTLPSPVCVCVRDLSGVQGVQKVRCEDVDPGILDIKAAPAETRLDEPIPPELLPTPDQQRRRRAAKSPRTTRDPPQPPLSALQKLSLSRKEARSTGATLSSTPAPSSTPAKPLSKLALLAQKRKEAALQAGISPGTLTLPSIPAETPTKGPSKLALKMAAARAARDQSRGDVEPDIADSPHVDMSNLSLTETTSDLFPSTSTPRQTSPFFNLLTATTKHPLSEPPILNLHLPHISDMSDLERRIDAAFSGDSPDDIILRARTRAHTKA